MLNTVRSTSCRSSAGFTLIELVITIAILGLLLMQAVPSYQEWIANTRVRTSTDAIQNGLMLAKAEALRRNAKVQLAFTSTEPTAANVNAIVTSTTGTSWVARIYHSTNVYTSADFIQGRGASDGGNNTTVTAGQSTLVFTGIGTLSPVPAADVAINVSGTGATRPLRITVSRAGAIRMCDPGLSIATSPMGC